MSPPLLETDRALLRPLLPADAPALGIAMRDANVTETISFDPPARTEAEGCNTSRGVSMLKVGMSSISIRLASVSFSTVSLSKSGSVRCSPF